jgi:hypothetical protein
LNQKPEVIELRALHALFCKDDFVQTPRADNPGASAAPGNIESVGEMADADASVGRHRQSVTGY